MSTLTITRGVPGCGKTHYAKQWVMDAAGRSRLNRDDLRQMMHGGAHGWPRELEDAITIAHHSSVRALLLAGRDVIVDDQSLSNPSVKVWMQVAASVGAEFDIVDFTNVPLETCIERDERRFTEGGRDHRVGAQYITSQYNRFIKGRNYPLPRPQLKEKTPDQLLGGEPYVAPEGAPKCILVDIDGTMALNTSGRDWFDWKRVGDDTPNDRVVELVRWLDDYSGFRYERDGDDFEIIFMSGRDEVCRPGTTLWLRDVGFGAHKLYMRPSLPDGVQQPADHIVKLALFDEHIRHQYDVQFVLDDRDQVVEMWRSLGLTCLQVAPGAF
jgi:predicted kinase